MSQSRRTFMQASGLSALAANAAAQSSSSAGKSANDKIQFALLGAGIMGQGDAKTASSIAGNKLVAVADIYQGRLDAMQERYGKDVFVTRDYREIIARKDIDAVIVATPDHWHAQMAIEAMKAGKDVYCQKPMVQKIADGHKVIAASKENNRILQVGSQRVSNLMYAKVRDLIKSGAIGEVNLIDTAIDRMSAIGAWQYSLPTDASPQTVDWDRFLGSAPKRPFEPVRLFRWRNYQDYGTGIPGDLFVHLLSGIHYMMDSIGPQSIMATGDLHYWKDGRDVPDVFVALYDYPKRDKHASFHVSMRTSLVAGGGEGQYFRIVGSEGMISMPVGGNAPVVITKRTPASEPGYSVDTYTESMQKAVLADYRKKYPVKEITVDSITGSNETRLQLPRNYSEQDEHHKVFWSAIRTRKPVVEDAVFGLRAAGPAISANTSLFEKRIVLWDADTMQTGKGSTPTN